MVKIIENYALHEQIGEGEYGKVYRGVDSKTGKDVAVKVIHAKKFKNNPKLQECTLNEIEVLSKIDSPYIVRFLEILKTANNFYFFYEYCNSGTLDKEIKAKGVLQQKQVLTYLEQILEGFKILSSKNIMHRDLKPENILIHNGQIKLGDFGFCKSLQNSRDLAQTMLGSPIYMAPEVLKGEIYTVKADIWSLGVVVYEMLFGFCPFEERSIAKLINTLDTQQLSFNSEVNRVSPILQELVRKMLVKDHFKRISWDQIFQYVISNGVIAKFRPSFTHCDPFYDRKPLECRVNEQSIREQQKMFKKKSDSAKKLKGDSNEVSNTLHEKLTQCVRLVYEFLQRSTDWEFAGELASRLYQIILKEHYRLTNRVEFIRERAEISQLVRVLQQDSRDTGLLLGRYIQFIRNARPAEFTDQMSSKKTIISCLKLLDFNDMRSSPTQYELMDNDKLVTYFNAKLPLNAI